jgi:hypothetical protein
MTTFYGSCPTCGLTYWADVNTGPEKAMCGPYVQVVCQAHHPVADVQLGNSLMFGHDDRRKWDRWRKGTES